MEFQGAIDRLRWKGRLPGRPLAKGLLAFVLVSAAAVVLGQIGGAGSSVGATQGMPSPSQVLDSYIKALGGADALHRHTSRTRKGLYKMDSGNTGTVVEYLTVNKMLARFTTTLGEFVQSTNGEIAWVSNPKRGPRLVERFIPEFWKREADLYYPLRIREYFSSYDVAGLENFEGHDCYHIKGITHWGDHNEQFYDRKTRLLVGYRFPTGPSKDAPLARMVFEDYKEFDGLMVPTKEINKDPDGVSTTTFTSVTFNDVDDAVFDPPPAVKQQVKDSKSK
jgi:hypothetical protein